jgi:abortive infection bacteriophage resistance protein
MNKPAYTISDQIALLKQRGMLFKNEDKAFKRLKNTSYYRLKGYWWDVQSDTSLHRFQPNTFFEDMMARYDFDRKLRQILFGGIEQIEIAVRTKLIYHLSLAYGGLWYLNAALFNNKMQNISGISKTVHLWVLDDLQKEFNRSQEIFIKSHQQRYPGQPADAWKMMEIASMGTLSKLYKNLNVNLPERGLIANEMGINSPHVFSGWLEAIAYMRNIIAHHSRLWSRTMVKRPSMQLNNPVDKWFTQPLQQGQLDKPFSTISCLLYLYRHLSRSDDMKLQIIELINAYANVPIYKIGFFNRWHQEPLWKV